LNDQIAEDVAYIRRRAEETGLQLHLTVSRLGFTIAAEGPHMYGSSSYYVADANDPILPGHFQLSVDQAIANALSDR
jgi:hypothetical protein